MIEVIVNVALLLTTFALGFAIGQAIEVIKGLKETIKECGAKCQK